ncbi:hypothetical protein [Paenibacillus glycinis]|uniref:Phospholipase C/D domain-containing protein n=1 Tax=Paenibacillus glycinis TaxID=2697035 RepID=A0ABW9XS85_9BACL|nr:hypothetical protein [Paenibacillus glycinis]NBD25524.1 hypothetical protein [Paenibacillus glycinis]
MPLPMVHLAIGVKYFEGRSIPPSFLLGCIAPDSVHMRKNANRNDKNKTHFEVQQKGLISLEGDYRGYISQSRDSGWNSFVKGYFAHIITDYYWVQNVYESFKKEALSNNFSKEEIKKTYSSETDEVDFYLYETKWWKEIVWEGLINSKIYGMSPLLSEQEINFWRLRTVHWFDLLEKKPGIGTQYITRIVVEDFIEETVDRVKTIIEDWDKALP